MRIGKAVVLSSIASGLILWKIPGLGILSRAVFLIDFNLLLFFVIGARSSFRILEHLYISKRLDEAFPNPRRKVLVYGAGKRGVYAFNEFISNPRSGLSPIGFIDDSPRYQGKQINGFPVLGNLDSLNGILAKNSITEVILCREDLPEEILNRLVEICNTSHIPLRRFKTHFEDINTSSQN
jgi:FlaA1/EpsC-like NDP-sugar epimerase